MVALQAGPIRVELLTAEVQRDIDGAVALFLGTVRDHNQGRRVLHLEYDAYPEMALKELEAIEREAVERFRRVAHRPGPSHGSIGDR